MRLPTATRRAPSALHPAALLLLLAALLPSCASVNERWVHSSYSGISYGSLYNVVLTTVDAEGFPVRTRDPGAGRIETDWVYGTTL